MNVYFKDAVKQFPGFTSKPYRDGSGDDMKIDGMNLFFDRGRLRAIFDEDDVVPEKLNNHIDGVSIHDYVTGSGRREFGIYSNETAKATVRYYEASKRSDGYQVRIIGKNVADAIKLLRLIKTGAIRPDESFEGEQLGLSRKELEVELERITTERDELSRKLGTITNKNTAIRNFLSDLRKRGWPFCMKSSIVDRISGILDGVTKIRL